MSFFYRAILYVFIFGVAVGFDSGPVLIARDAATTTPHADIVATLKRNAITYFLFSTVCLAALCEVVNLARKTFSRACSKLSVPGKKDM